MNIKDVIISRTNSESEVKAIASVAFDNGMTIRGIKIIEIEGAPFTSIPVTEVLEGKFKGLVRPVNSEMVGKIKSAVEEKYYELLMSEQESPA